MTLGLPLLVGWTAALLLAGLDGRRRGVGLLALALGAALVACLAALSVEVAQAGAVQRVTGGWPREVGITLRADALGTLFALASAALVVAVLAFEVARGPESRSFPALVLFLATGLSGLFLTGDVFNFYVFFELSMISAFALAGYGRGQAESRAGAVFVVINLIGSVLFLASVAMLYRLTGTLDMAAVAAAVRDERAGSVLMVGTLLLVAFGLKLGLFPFHFWLPVVYRETRPAVAALFAGALANIGSYGLLRFGGEILPGILDTGRPALLGLGTASIVYGGVQAVHRRALRDVLAYSSIGQVGYVLAALSLGGRAGFAAAALYAIVNALHKTGLFLGAGASGRGVAAGFLVSGLSLAGLPPSAGFLGKVALFRSGIEAGSAALLCVFAVGSALTFLYIVQAWQQRWWAAPWPRGGRWSPPGARSVPALLAAVAVALGVWPEPLVEWSLHAAAVLTGAP